MPPQVCAPQPFEGTQQFEVPWGTTITQLSRVVHGPVTWIMQVCRRPIIPIWGVIRNNTTTTYDFLPSTKANFQALIDIGISAFKASYNYENNILTPEAYDPSDGQDFGTYTNRKIGSSDCLYQRYLEVYNKAATFFRLHPAIVAYDLPLYKELTDLVAKIQRESDKQMMIMPGRYTFDAGSAAHTSLEAWFLSDPVDFRLYSIELITT